ncbi:MAG TPA: hypothetical protein VFF27_16920, partial [Bacteroidia bacterium]|nr:hypothetical protein [Bacteroidia bacterium]
MKNKILLYSFSILLLLSFNAVSQSTDDLQSIKIIEKGIALHDEKKYDEAIAEYKKVSRSDTNYVLAATELATTYCTSGKDSLGLALANDLLEIKSSYIPMLLAIKANALDNLKRSDEALKVYEEGMKRFPLNYVFTYELGVAKLRQEKYKEAYDWFVKSVKVNPYRASTHYYLGYTAMKQGKQVQTMLAWLFYLTIDHESDRSREIVLMLEKMAKNEFDFEKTVKVDELDEQDDFSEMETLVRS